MSSAAAPVAFKPTKPYIIQKLPRIGTSVVNVDVVPPASMPYFMSECMSIR